MTAPSLREHARWFYLNETDGQHWPRSTFLSGRSDLSPLGRARNLTCTGVSCVRHGRHADRVARSACFIRTRTSEGVARRKLRGDAYLRLRVHGELCQCRPTGSSLGRWVTLAHFGMHIYGRTELDVRFPQPSWLYGATVFTESLQHDWDRETAPRPVQGHWDSARTGRESSEWTDETLTLWQRSDWIDMMSQLDETPLCIGHYRRTGRHGEARRLRQPTRRLRPKIRRGYDETSGQEERPYPRRLSALLATGPR